MQHKVCRREMGNNVQCPQRWRRMAGILESCNTKGGLGEGIFRGLNKDGDWSPITGNWEALRSKSVDLDPPNLDSKGENNYFASKGILELWKLLLWDLSRVWTQVWRIHEWGSIWREIGADDKEN